MMPSLEFERFEKLESVDVDDYKVFYRRVRTTPFYGTINWKRISKDSAQRILNKKYPMLLCFYLFDQDSNESAILDDMRDFLFKDVNGDIYKIRISGDTSIFSENDEVFNNLLHAYIDFMEVLDFPTIHSQALL